MSPDSDARTPFPVRRVHEVEPRASEQRWLVDELFASASVGLLGGPPKACLCRARDKNAHAASRIMPRSLNDQRGLWIAHAE